MLAAAPDVVVVEDDSAGDIASSTLFSIGTWLPDHTVHIRSFSKSHGPDLRLAAMGGPAAILDPLLERRLLGQGWTSRLLQHLLLDLLADAAASRRWRGHGEEYARRRRLVCEALLRAGIAGGGGELNGADGINLWLPVADEQAALINLASHGIGVAAGSGFVLAPSADPVPHLRVTVGLVPGGHAQLAGTLAAAARAGTWTVPR